MEIINQLSQLAPLLSFITVLVAVVFGIIQLKQFNRQRKDLAALEVMRSMQTRDFTDSLVDINKIEKGLSRKLIQKNHQEIEGSILAFVTKFETLGFLVYRKVIPIDLVEELVGGECIRIWDKLDQYIQDFRIEENNPILLEWFEWLTYQFKKNERHKSLSALDKYPNWKK